MRIIAGAYKGRRLARLEPKCKEIRPTSDMAREALFNILERWPKGAFLDLFSGTGAVALEALSRGYSPVWCVENDKNALAHIQNNGLGMDLHILGMDACRIKSGKFSNLSVIFADPPYEKSLEIWETIAERICCFLAPQGVIVWECRKAMALPKISGLSPVEERKYGEAKFIFLKHSD